jgi:NAD(P)-dependent dehydrogenase (short-subunit alcohol dehydrogenase family)
MIRLDGRSVVVTGAGRGLGRAYVHALAAAGAGVVVNNRSPEAAHRVVEEIRAGGGTAVAHVGSVADWTVGDELVALARKEFGDLHILVNNAGALRDRMCFNISEDDWDEVIDGHLKGHFACSRAAATYWRSEHKAGRSADRRIINATAEGGLFASPGHSNYIAAKAGIVGLTWALACELAPYGTTVNALATRARTGMTESMPMFAAPEHGFDRFDPDNAAPVVVWLASDDAGHVNGQVFIVVGGDIHLVEGTRVVSSIHRSTRWTPSELAIASAELFEGRWPAAVPSTPIR